MIVTRKTGVQFVRSEIAKKISQWTVIRDCLDGEQQIKNRGTVYLPYPSITADNCVSAKDNKEYYEAYKNRAVFLNVVRRTLYELLAQVFVREPIVETDKNKIMEYVMSNATGNGVDLQQCAKQSLSYALAYAYGGVFVDFPETDGAVSLKDFEEGGYRPTITPYSPFSIQNFRIEDVGAEERLTLVVLGESFFQIANDGFEIKECGQLRVLRLENGLYKQDIYRSYTDVGTDYKDYKKEITITPTDANGNTLNYIPFYFIGMENNNPYPDNVIMYDLASLNIAHYRNSADYEHGNFIAGQPTLFISGLKGNKSVPIGTQELAIKLGSDHAINLENGGTAGFIQAKADSSLAEAMKEKKQEMTSFGAKFLEQDNVAKTAYQVKVENPSQGSILGNCVKNVSNAYTKALKTAHKLCGLDDSKVKFELNTDFEYNRVGSDEQNFYINAWKQGALVFEEMRACLRRGGSATLDDATALAQIEKERAKAQEEALATAQAQADTTRQA